MEARPDDGSHFFTTDEKLTYVPFCDDFGPMNLMSIMAFADILECKLEEFPEEKIIYCADSNPRSMTNAAFLIGSYMILKMGLSPDDVWSTFNAIETIFAPYRDATFLESDFELTLLDCWKGLARAKNLQWVDMYDFDEYCHYDNPLEGDLHIIVPNKLIAFQGPKDLSGGELFKDVNGNRLFSPKFYVDIFHEMEVEAVVRLNEREYKDNDFTDHGIKAISLEFEDCTAPPPDIIVQFMEVVTRSKGAVAVHCKAGLGRTGTLIAIYLILIHGFTAKEAIGWIRIVRPGSIIGEQQHFLCMIERIYDKTVTLRNLNSIRPPPASSDQLAMVAHQASEAMQECLESAQEREQRAKTRAEQLARGLGSEIRTLRRAHFSAACSAAPGMPIVLPDLNADS